MIVGSFEVAVGRSNRIGVVGITQEPLTKGDEAILTQRRLRQVHDYQ